MAREHRFEYIEHTADIGVIGRGATKAEAFESTAYGMFSVMARLEGHTPTDSRIVTAAGEDDITLLERFLSALVYLFDTEKLLPTDVEITEMSDGKLTCRVSTREIGDDIEWLGPVVKAVTYHQMTVESREGEWFARAILDV